MKEKGIIFQTDMVRAIIARIKWMTRRIKFKCEIGDHLYVKETFKDFNDGDLYFKADFENGSKPVHSDDEIFKWKPPIYMFKKYARIWLEVIGFRKERLQNITNDDCIAEGCPYTQEYLMNNSASPTEWFEDLWNSINEKRGYGWDLNPEIDIISFKVIDK